MIHKAARELAVRQFGEAVWDDILSSCEMSTDHFLSGQHYPDDLTNRLIEEIVARSGMSTGELLAAFGRYWIEFVDKSAYASVMDMAGDDLLTFLKNLDRVHSSIKATMPEATVPSFEVVRASPDAIHVVYRSPRKGLEPFVKGLLEGLLDRFSEDGTVSIESDGDYATFLIKRTRASRVA